jgi:hypothetical protein
MRVRVFTSRTLRSTRGRHHTRSNTALFVFAVTRSVAADEKKAHVFLERVRAATASKSWLLMSVSSGGWGGRGGRWKRLLLVLLEPGGREGAGV